LAPVTRDPFQPLLQNGVYILFAGVPIFFLGWLFFFVFGLLLGSILNVLLSALAGNYLCLKIFEDRGLEGMAMPLNRAGAYNSATGLALGFGAAALVVMALLFTGQAHEVPAVVTAGAPVTNWREEMFVPIVLLLGAVGEEILFRGFGFQVLLREFGVYAAILPTGILFGLAHISNAHSTWLGLLNTIGFGVLFCYAFVRSHDIWFPIGMHFGWNLMLLLFGADISGIKIRVTGYEIAWNTTPLWSGGDYGPEASVLTSVVLALLSVAVWKVRLVRQEAYLVDVRVREES
jgi:membrane protease YdiL (CAAX protease family)